MIRVSNHMVEQWTPLPPWHYRYTMSKAILKHKHHNHKYICMWLTSKGVQASSDPINSAPDTHSLYPILMWPLCTSCVSGVSNWAWTLYQPSVTSTETCITLISTYITYYISFMNWSNLSSDRKSQMEKTCKRPDSPGGETEKSQVILHVYRECSLQANINLKFSLRK